MMGNLMIAPGRVNETMGNHSRNNSQNFEEKISREARKSNDDQDIGDTFPPEKNTAAVYSSTTERYASHYKMDHAKRGFAIIFNHEIFMGGHSPRPETKVDCELLKSTLEYLGFEVHIYNNFTLEHIMKILKMVAETDHSDHDCLLIASLSHGKLGFISAYDTDYRKDILWSFFTSDKCPTLASKPKLFFIQACQDDKFDSGIVLNRRTHRDGESNERNIPQKGPETKMNVGDEEEIETDGQVTASTFRIPCHADFLIASSTVPDSLFIRNLCLELRENGFRYDLLTLLTAVCQQVAIDWESHALGDPTNHQQKQIPYITSMLTRIVKFMPKKEQI